MEKALTTLRKEAYDHPHHEEPSDHVYADIEMPLDLAWYGPLLPPTGETETRMQWLARTLQYLELLAVDHVLADPCLSSTHMYPPFFEVAVAQNVENDEEMQEYLAWCKDAPVNSRVLLSLHRIRMALTEARKLRREQFEEKQKQEKHAIVIGTRKRQWSQHEEKGMDRRRRFLHELKRKKTESNQTKPPRIDMVV